ncbi:MAG: hypothetical protein RL112_343 [Planctomycetota bacterium]
MGERVVFGVVGDVHAHMAHLEAACAALEAEGPLAAVLLVGDLGDAHLGHARLRTPRKDALWLESVARVLERARALGASVRYVPGNHDLPTLPDEPRFAGNLDGRVESLAGVRVAGFGGAGPGFFGFPYEWSDAQARARGIPACDLILAHAPPRGTSLDLLWDRRRHVGSAFLRERLESHAGAFACGHIHESGGVELVGRAACVNAGGLGAPRGAPQVGLLALEDGRWRAEHLDLALGARRVVVGPPVAAGGPP